jgi:hypothetical protein
MFHRDGRWKEFGVNGVETTYVPFWLFCIVWAIVSYAILRMLVSDEGGHGAHAAHAAHAVAVSPKNIVKPEPEALEPLPVSTPPPNTPEGQPGYYKLDEAVMKEKGTPLYIYIGPEKPSDVS